VPVVAVAVVITAAVVLLVLWRWIDGLAFADQEKRAAAQLDAVKIAASIAVGGGGLFALYLAARRQRTQELELEVRHAELRHREAELAQRDQAQAHAEEVAEHNHSHALRIAQDARDHAEFRQLTELYAQSVEQLGSDQAPVRLGGLYALERLAQADESQRQTIVDLFCAYLRMAHDHHPHPQQEAQVRSAVQATLARHLRPGRDPDRPVATFWDGIDVDLSAATLTDLGLPNSRIRTLDLSGARLDGATDLSDATLGDTSFRGAQVHGPVQFIGTTFSGTAEFTGARFGDETWFANAVFRDGADFGHAQFAGTLTRFNGAKVHGNANFHRARFAGTAGFELASFRGPADFVEAEFDGPARFATRFRGNALFLDAVFRDVAAFGVQAWCGSDFRAIAGFDGAVFTGDAVFTGVTFRGKDAWSVTEWLDPHGSPRRVVSTGTQFTRVVFEADALFDGARFAGPTHFDDAVFGRYVTFAGAEPGGGRGRNFHFLRARARTDVPDHLTHRIWPAGFGLAEPASAEPAPPGWEGTWSRVERLPRVRTRGRSTARDGAAAGSTEPAGEPTDGSGAEP
jgi:uncharacterized protein YjbI with pentapeptide repeats